MKVPLLRLGLHLRQHREYCQGRVFWTLDLEVQQHLVFLLIRKCHSHKVEQALLKDEAFQKLVNFFQSCLEDHHFVHMLEPFLKIITYVYSLLCSRLFNRSKMFLWKLKWSLNFFSLILIILESRESSRINKTLDRLRCLWPTRHSASKQQANNIESALFW